MNTDNIIVINGSSFEIIEKALLEWIDLCSENLQGQRFELYAGDPLYIKVNPDIDNFNFCYLINYLTFPEALKENVRGMMRIQDEHFPQHLQKKDALVIIPKHESDVDNVYIVCENGEGYKYDMGGRLTVVETPVKFENIVVDFESLETPEIFYPKVVQKRSVKPRISEEEKVIQRYKIGKIVFYTALITCLIFFIIKPDAFFLLLPVACLYYLWLFMDYKVLQFDQHYYSLLILAGLYLILGRIILFYTSSIEIEVFTALPATMLFIQRIARGIFLYFYNREPVVEHTNKKFADFLYEMGILMGPLFLSILISKL